MSNNLVPSPFCLLCFTSCSAQNSPATKLIYVGVVATPPTPQPTNQKERHAICAVSCLVTCQQRKKTNRRRRRSWWVMNGRLWRYGNVQGLVRTSNDHIVFHPNPSSARTKAFFPVHVAPDYWQQKSARSTYQFAALRRTWRHLFCSTITSEFFILLQSCQHSQDTEYMNVHR